MQYKHYNRLQICSLFYIFVFPFFVVYSYLYMNEHVVLVREWSTIKQTS